MISFDITDRNIRIIRGNESSGRIKIVASVNIAVDEGVITNGIVRDMQKVVSLISMGLRSKNIKDKEAVISISSNLVMFKELHVPKAKPVQFKQMVKNQMQQAMNTADEHCVSFTVAGDYDNNGQMETKVLANACPKDVIDGYCRVFGMLGLTIKSVSVSCNCISKIVLSDPQNLRRMPFLLVQIDPYFININLYENGQLSFSRFASISPDDYEDKNDYVFQAVNENIFRMLQFQRSRSRQVIQNVIFYGDTRDYMRLANALEQMDISTSQLRIPDGLSGYGNLEFSLYANAIGAMYKRRKDDDTTNLLVGEGKISSRGLPIAKVTKGNTDVLPLFALIASAAVVAVGFVGISSLKQAKLSEIRKIDEYINSQEIQDQIAEIDKKQVMCDKLKQYNTKCGSLKELYNTHPQIDKTTFETILAVIGGNVKIAYQDGVMSGEIKSDNINVANSAIQKFYESGLYDNIVYNGYKSADNDTQGTAAPAEGELTSSSTGKYTSEFALQLKSPKQLEKEKEEKDKAEGHAEVENAESGDKK